MSSPSSAMRAAAMFSSRCVTDEVPGMSRTYGSRCNSHARAIWAGVEACFAATEAIAGSSASALVPPANGDAIGKNRT